MINNTLNAYAVVGGSSLIANLLAILAITAIALVFMLGSSFIERTLGENGLNIVNRVFGLLLLAIALTSIVTSLQDLFPGWMA